MLAEDNQLRDARRFRAMMWCGINKDSQDPKIVAIQDGMPDPDALDVEGDEVGSVVRMMDAMVVHLMANGIDLDLAS